jgi:predicted O-methyltransferase YrrM
MSDVEVARLVELAAGRTVLEVGTYLGHSAVAMAHVAKVVHTVDWHRGDPHAGDEETAHTFLDNLVAHGVRDSVIPHIGRSEDVLPLFREGSFDFAFHDAYHTTEAVWADAILMAGRLAPGSLLAFHDYGLFGVKAAVDRLGPLVELTETLAVVRV